MKVALNLIYIIPVCSQTSWMLNKACQSTQEARKWSRTNNLSRTGRCHPFMTALTPLLKAKNGFSVFPTLTPRQTIARTHQFLTAWPWMSHLIFIRSTSKTQRPLNIDSRCTKLSAIITYSSCSRWAARLIRMWTGSNKRAKVPQRWLCMLLTRSRLSIQAQPTLMEC